MRTIWKFPLVPESEFTLLRMPEGAVVRAFAMQDGIPTVWAEVDPDASRVNRRFHIAGTGFAIPPGATYRGTTQDPPFVWHLYEQTDD